MYSRLEMEKKLGVKSYVLRFWENSFSQVHPIIKNENEKFYSEKDFQVFQLIQKYLQEEGLSMEDAQKKLEEAVPGSEQKENILHFSGKENKSILGASEEEFLKTLARDIENILITLRSGL